MKKGNADASKSSCVPRVRGLLCEFAGLLVCWFVGLLVWSIPKQRGRPSGTAEAFLVLVLELWIWVGCTQASQAETHGGPWFLSERTNGDADRESPIYDDGDLFLKKKERGE